MKEKIGYSKFLKILEAGILINRSNPDLWHLTFPGIKIFETQKKSEMFLSDADKLFIEKVKLIKKEQISMNDLRQLAIPDFSDKRMSAIMINLGYKKLIKRQEGNRVYFFK